MYVFLLDVSHAAVETGYLGVFCETLLDELDRLPGDGRTQVRGEREMASSIGSSSSSRLGKLMVVLVYFKGFF